MAPVAFFIRRIIAYANAGLLPFCFFFEIRCRSQLWSLAPYCSVQLMMMLHNRLPSPQRTSSQLVGPIRLKRLVPLGQHITLYNLRSSFKSQSLCLAMHFQGRTRKGERLTITVSFLVNYTIRSMHHLCTTLTPNEIQSANEKKLDRVICANRIIAKQ